MGFCWCDYGQEMKVDYTKQSHLCHTKLKPQRLNCSFNKTKYYLVTAATLQSELHERPFFQNNLHNLPLLPNKTLGFPYVLRTHLRSNLCASNCNSNSCILFLNKLFAWRFVFIYTYFFFLSLFLVKVDIHFYLRFSEAIAVSLMFS